MPDTLSWRPARLYGIVPYKETAMAQVARLELRLDDKDKERIARAAAARGVPVAAFVREAVLREAESTLAHPPRRAGASLADRLRGRATSRMSTDEIMQLTRGA